MSKMEMHSEAWHRVYWFRHKNARFMSEDDCPIRLRGYTELVMGNLAPKLRKKLDSALKRGYALENRTQLPYLLRLIEEFNPVKPVPIGYMGKTEFEVYVPTNDDAVDLRKELHAQTVMTDAFKGSNIHSSFVKYGMYGVACNVRYRRDATGEAAHLRSCFKEMRPAIDEWMAAWARDREAIAQWCADDSSTIRIPFDTNEPIKRSKKP